MLEMKALLESVYQTQTTDHKTVIYINIIVILLY